MHLQCTCKTKQTGRETTSKATLTWFNTTMKNMHIRILNRELSCLNIFLNFLNKYRWIIWIMNVDFTYMQLVPFISYKIILLPAGCRRNSRTTNFVHNIRILLQWGLCYGNITYITRERLIAFIWITHLLWGFLATAHMMHLHFLIKIVLDLVCCVMLIIINLTSAIISWQVPWNIPVYKGFGCFSV